MTSCLDNYEICVNLAFREMACDVLLFNLQFSYPKAQTDLGKQREAR